MMNNLLKKLDNIIQKRAAYYASDKFIVGKLESAPLIIVSAAHVLERKTFFKITKKKDLNLAIDLFIKKSSPFQGYYSWFDSFKVQGGHFVVVYYVKESLYQALKNRQIKGGMILPEQALVRKQPKGFITNIDRHGSYVDDPNFKVQFNLPQSDLLSRLFDTQESSLEFTDFVTHLLKTLNVKQLLPYWRAWHGGNKAGFDFSIGHLFLVFSVPLIYFSLTSFWLYIEHEKALKAFEENKERIAEYKNLERNFVQMQSELARLKSPFQNYQYAYQAFDVMNKMDVFVNVQSFSINSTEISINGTTDDASLVFKRLSEDTRLKDLRYVRPVRKSGKRDTFTIGFKLESS